MKDKLNTRYIGNTEKWIDFWLYIAKTQSFNGFFGFEEGQRLLIEINKNLSSILVNYHLYQYKIEAYPFEIPNSFKDMWLSGTVDIFENIFNYFEGYQDDFKPNKGNRYFKLFLNPEYVQRFQSLIEKKGAIFSNSAFQDYMLETMIDRQNSSEGNVSKENFYRYPHDEATCPIALTSKSMYEMYILVDGWIEVDGGALFMFTDQSFADNEFEVGIWSYSEASWQRYQTMPEPFLYKLAYILFEAEVHSVNDLLKVDSVFQLLYK